MEMMAPEERKQLLTDNVVLLGYRGSVAHGMYLPGTDPNSVDDVDLMAVYMAPVGYYLGLDPLNEGTDRTLNQWDVVRYEFKKFVQLLLNSNPNVLSMLWLKDEFYLEKHPYGQLLLDNKNWFVSKEAYKPFAGYAAGQLKRMENAACKGYMGDKRRRLVEKYGYDCKNAAHCLRLLKMCAEFLNTGEMKVFRDEDVSWLLSVKRGEWALDKVKSEADRLFAAAKTALAKSKLPEKPDYDKVNELVKDVMLHYVNSRR